MGVCNLYFHEFWDFDICVAILLVSMQTDHDSNTGTTPNGTSYGTAAGRGRDYQQTPPVHGSKAGENTIAGASYHGDGSQPNGRRPGVVL